MRGTDEKGRKVAMAQLRSIQKSLTRRSLTRHECYRNRRRRLEYLAGRSQAAGLRVNAKNNNVIGFLIGCEQIRARRVNRKIAWRLTLRRNVLYGREGTLGGINIKNGNAVVPAVRGIKEFTCRMHLQLGRIVIASKIFGQCRNRLQLTQAAFRRVVRTTGDRGIQLVNRIGKFAAVVKDKVPWAGAWNKLHPLAMVRRNRPRVPIEAINDQLIEP